MKKDEIEAILKAHKQELATRFFVEKIGLFGSYARNEQNEESDIDILVEFSRPVGFEFLDLKDYLETIFKSPVDLVTVNALKPFLRNEILGEVQFQ